MRESAVLNRIAKENALFAGFSGCTLKKTGKGYLFCLKEKTILEVALTENDSDITLEITGTITENLSASTKGIYTQALTGKIESMLKLTERIRCVNDSIRLTRFISISKIRPASYLRYYSFSLQEVLYKCGFIGDMLYEEFRKYMDIILN